MADADNNKNERIQKSAHLRKASINGSPLVSKESTAGNISDTSLRKIQKVAQQLVMNSPDRQRSLIRPHLRASVPPHEYDSPDSCPPPPNNTPDSGPSNATSNKGTANSIVKVLKPQEKNINLKMSPMFIPECSPIGMLKPPEKSSRLTVSPTFLPETPIQGIAPPKSSRWTVTPLSIASTPDNFPESIDSIPGNTEGTSPHITAGKSKSESSPINNSSLSTPGSVFSKTAPTYCRKASSVQSFSQINNSGMSTPGSVFSSVAPTLGSKASSVQSFSQLNNSNLSTPASVFSNIAPTPNSKTSSVKSPIPSIVVTPPEEPCSNDTSTPESPFSTNNLSIPRLRSDSEGSLSSILSLKSSMMKLIDTSPESNNSSFEELKDVQSDESSECESPSLNSKSSPKQSPKDDGCKKKEKDLRKKLLQDLMSAEVSRREEEMLKKHNIKLMDSCEPKHIHGQKKIQHVSHQIQPTNSSVSCKLMILILCLTLASFLVAFLFTNILGRPQKFHLVGDYDSNNDASDSNIGSWLPENEKINQAYKYSGIRDVLSKINSDNFENEDNSMLSGHNGKDKNIPTVYHNDINNFEGADLDILQENKLGNWHKYGGIPTKTTDENINPALVYDDVKENGDYSSKFENTDLDENKDLSDHYSLEEPNDFNHFDKETNKFEEANLEILPETEKIGKLHKYGGIREVTRITDDGNKNNPTSTIYTKDLIVNSNESIKFEENLDIIVQDVTLSYHELEKTNDEFKHDIDLDDEERKKDSNDMNESLDSDKLDNGIIYDELIIENMKPSILKLLYYNILKCNENGDISLQSYTDMYLYLNNFLTTFGSFAATQSKMLDDRINTLEELKYHSINYKYASTMFKYELETGLIDKEIPLSGSMIFTCLHRHLQYLQEALENIANMQPRESLYIAFKAAYDDILADYHHWFVEKFYLLGLSTLPTKADALQRLNERFVETVSMAQLSNGLKIISQQLQDLNQVTEILLNKNNVTKRIPAQVIT